MFDVFFNDTVTIVHKDGTTHEDVRAMVSEQTVQIQETSIPIFVGDRIERQLPSGQLEVLSVTQVHFTRGFGGIPDFYKINCEPAQKRGQVPDAQSVNIHVSGSPQARVNINAVDSSMNTISVDVEEVFENVRARVASSVEDADERDDLLALVNGMENGYREGNFTDAYKTFVATAAQHMTVLGPVIPALTSLLGT